MMMTVMKKMIWKELLSPSQVHNASRSVLSPLRLLVSFGMTKKGRRQIMWASEKMNAVGPPPPRWSGTPRVIGAATGAIGARGRALAVWRAVSNPASKSLDGQPMSPIQTFFVIPIIKAKISSYSWKLKGAIQDQRKGCKVPCNKWQKLVQQVL